MNSVCIDDKVYAKGFITTCIQHVYHGDGYSKKQQLLYQLLNKSWILRISFICHFMNESNALCILIIIGLIDKWMLAHATIIIMKC